MAAYAIDDGAGKILDHLPEVCHTFCHGYGHGNGCCGHIYACIYSVVCHNLRANHACAEIPKRPASADFLCLTGSRDIVPYHCYLLARTGVVLSASRCRRFS